MKITRTVEIGVGLFVCLGIAALVMLSFRVANLNAVSTTHGYKVTAYFENIGSLQARAAVKMGGVLIGRVSGIHYDPKRFQAVVEMRLDDAYKTIPADSSASVFTAGLLGEQYIGLDPGGADTYLADGAEIKLTQSALVLERALQEFLYSKTAKGSEPTK